LLHFTPSHDSLSYNLEKQNNRSCLYFESFGGGKKKKKYFAQTSTRHQIAP